ncbi:LexA family protein [Zunongwangia sp. H14]|uniref:LexA family protein n=1 Tax=Zunongwangia sp. H14 TaxID=3240792 RepID=UPI003568399C
MKIFLPENTVSFTICLMSSGISAGFPSPADDHLEDRIDLNRELIRNKDSTFFGRVEGDSMKNAGIEHGDLLVIDKSLEARNGKIAVCFIDGDFTVKRIKVENDMVWLVAENEKYKPIKVTKDNDLLIWGIVVHVIKSY